MKHRKGQRSLGRVRQHRRALLKNLTSSLLREGTVVTTEAKAKELRRWFEPLVTEAKGELTLHRRRHLLRQLGDKADLVRLTEVASDVKRRPGGYMRLTRLPEARSDGATLLRVDVVRE